MTERYLNVVEARREFGNLILDAMAGKSTVITRYGAPAAAIVPAPDAGQSRTVNLASGTSVTVTISGPVLNLPPKDREWVFDLIELFKALEAAVAKPEQAESGQS